MLTNQEAQILIDLLKKQKKISDINFPSVGEQKSIEVVSDDNTEKFLIDVDRGRIDVSKCTYQERYNKYFPLIRLDICDSFHYNPDGEKIVGSHIHIYDEEYEMRFAHKIPHGIIKDKSDIIQILIDFLEYCNVNQYGNIVDQRRFL